MKKSTREIIKILLESDETIQELVDVTLHPYNFFNDPYQFLSLRGGLSNFRLPVDSPVHFAEGVGDERTVF